MKEKQAIVLVDSWSHAMLKVVESFDSMDEAIKFVESAEIPDQFTFCIVPMMNTLAAETLFFAMKENENPDIPRKSEKDEEIERDPLTGAQLRDISPTEYLGNDEVAYPSDDAEPMSKEIREVKKLYEEGNLIDLSTGEPIAEDDPQHPDNPDADRGEEEER